MSKAQLCALVCFWFGWQYANGYVASAAIGTVGGTRSLQQEAASVQVATGVQVADFSYLTVDLTGAIVVRVPEFPLEGSVNVSITMASSEAVPYGTYFLGPTEVQDLVEAISTEMVCLLLVLCVPLKAQQ